MQALIMNSRDNVATAVRSLKRLDNVVIQIGENSDNIVVQSDIPFGHKLAIVNIERGENVVKYGETIGRAVVGIRKGEHVHVHNVEGLRGRGDRE